ncbi:MAG: four helix bundle protein [Flavobacteriales bacterium]|nr:four helix bundle protein [Flavobacteriales bacterium]
MESYFDFENLEVWQKAVEFSKEVIQFSEKLKVNSKSFRLVEQLESASTSIAMNIAEGKGRNSKKEFLQFLYYSRGSIFEVITLLKILFELERISDEEFERLRKKSIEISKMLNGLIKYQRSLLKSG